MKKFIICSNIEAESAALRQYIGCYCGEKNIESNVDICQNWPELKQEMKKEEKDVVIVALNGVTGLDIVTNILPVANSIIWISDLDFAIQSYRLCVTYFFTKPISYEKMEKALDQYLRSRAW